MPDQESALEQEAVVANNGASQDQTDSQASADGSEAEGLSELEQKYDALRKRLDKKERQDQSGKDKEFANLRKEINSLKETIVNLAEQNDSRPVSSGKKEQADEGLSEAQNMFVKFGLGETPEAVANSPEFLEFFRLHGGNIDKDKAIDFLALRKGASKSVSAASITQPPGSAVKASDMDALQAEYQEKLSKLPYGNTMAVTQLQMEYRKKGLQL